MLTKADDIIRFLDTGFNVMLFKNRLGTYSARLLVKSDEDEAEYNVVDCDEHTITDANTPSKALYELSQKILKNGIREAK